MTPASELAWVARLIEEAKRRILEASRPPEPEGGWRTLALVIADSAVDWRAGAILVLVKSVPLLLERSGRARRAGPVQLTAYVGLSSLRPEERGAFTYTSASALAASELLKRVEPDALFIYQAAATFPPEAGVREQLPLDIPRICRELRGVISLAQLHEAAYKGMEMMSRALRLKHPQPLITYLSEYCAMAAALAELREVARDVGVPLAWVSRCSRRLARSLGLDAWVTDEALLSFAWEGVDRAAIHALELADDYLAKQLAKLVPILAARRTWYYKLGPAGSISRMTHSGSLSEGWYLLGMLASAADKHGRLRVVERGAALASVRRGELESAWSHVQRTLSSSALRLLLS
ncbi:MAG: hypothetical protein DRJ96_05340 [Thermoprotei archaeon]|nr:MAG: hypothetical protein DRJ96_05340 [Thermoprotei archaeon]